MAANANSPSDWLNTPLPLVSGTGLETSSGKSTLSSPAERECTQRTCLHMAKTSCSNFFGADQAKMTTGPSTAPAKACGSCPTMCGSPSNMLNCGSSSEDNTKIVCWIALPSRRFPCRIEFYYVAGSDAILDRDGR